MIIVDRPLASGTKNVWVIWGGSNGLGRGDTQLFKGQHCILVIPKANKTKHFQIFGWQVEYANAFLLEMCEKCVFQYEAQNSKIWLSTTIFDFHKTPAFHTQINNWINLKETFHLFYVMIFPFFRFSEFTFGNAACHGDSSNLQNKHGEKRVTSERHKNNQQQWHTHKKKKHSYGKM